MILAYEPVWAIGTGKTATPDIITETHLLIRNILNDIGFDGEKISILYGGSVNRNNAKELIKLNNVDGFLIGGASLDVEHFFDIYKIIKESI
jgi:triosephosphate isomerase